MRLLHQLLPARAKKDEKSVLFFAGGGTNSATNYYSAYTLSKIALIKACELLDSEINDVKFSVIGPGWVKTKIHQATLECKESWAVQTVEKTARKMLSDDCISMDAVIHSFEWVLEQSKKIVGGRNFSTASDCWGNEQLSKMLESDQSMYKLRRHKNEILIRGAL
jgi:short-subunit dehydrogenase